MLQPPVTRLPPFGPAYLLIASGYLQIPRVSTHVCATGGFGGAVVFSQSLPAGDRVVSFSHS